MKKLLKSRFVYDYGSVFVLLLLCAYYSVATWGEQHPDDPRAGRQLAQTIVDVHGDNTVVLIVARETKLDRAFAEAVQHELQTLGAKPRLVHVDEPAAVRRELVTAAEEEAVVHAIATHHQAAQWGPLQADRLAKLAADYPALNNIRVHIPESYMWPSFFTRANLINVINQNAEVFIIAIGMTMVIITAGIDLSVGSLLSLCGVITAVAIQGWAGGAEASVVGIIACCLLGIAAGALVGAFNGVMATFCRVPAFIVTLAMMRIARGMSLNLAVGFKHAQSGGATAGTPEAISVEAPNFDWLGGGESFGIPHPIILMLLLYVIAHLVMTRTSLGRYIYAVGGNIEAARLSGVPVFGILILVYMLCGAAAGLAGIVDASRFNGGRPNAGEYYELQVIAAVVVGGTSLFGGEGRIFGTLIGALIIAVIDNGLNMAGVQPYNQMIVFGFLILAAALLDQLKKRLSER